MGATSHAAPKGSHHHHGRGRSWSRRMNLHVDTFHHANGGGAHASANGGSGRKDSKSPPTTLAVGGGGGGGKASSELTTKAALRSRESIPEGGGATYSGRGAEGGKRGDDVAVVVAGAVGGGGGGAKEGSIGVGGGVDLEAGQRLVSPSPSGGLSARRAEFFRRAGSGHWSMANPKDPQDWLSSHHNPDSPLNSAPSTGPNTPTGREAMERWDHWLVELKTPTSGLSSRAGDGDGRGGTGGGGGGSGGYKRDADELLGSLKKTTEEVGRFTRYWHWIAGPKSKRLREITGFLFVLTCVAAWWAAVYLVEGARAGLDSEIFAAISLLVVAFVVGELANRLLGLHPLLGSIAGGFLLRYVPGVEVGVYISDELAGHVRNLALVIILLRAGLSLDVATLVKIPELCTVSPTVPLVVEASMVAALTTWLLDFSWTWAFMTGFLVSAVSPGVVVPVLLSLAEKGYGVEEGIPSLVLAVAALCDVFAIVGYAAFAEAAFKGEGVSMSLAHVVLELALGVLGGLFVGGVITFLTPRGIIAEPDTDVASLKKTVAHNEIDGRSTASKRTLLTIGMGFVTYYSLKHYHYTGAAAMAAFVMGIPPAQGWGRRRTGRTQTQIARAWIYVAQPLLFGVIGAKLEIAMLTTSLLWRGFVILVIAGAVRWVVTVLVTWVGHVTLSERMFIASAWISKATVQAALGPTPLHEARVKGDPMEIEMGEQVLVLATIAILVSAPAGAILSKILGPKLLRKGEAKNVDLAGH